VDLEGLNQVVQTGGVVGLLVTIVWGALKEWWVPGRVHRRTVAEKDFWRTHALENTRLTAKAVDLISPASEER